jgi:hypothetical protein
MTPPARINSIQLFNDGTLEIVTISWQHESPKERVRKVSLSGLV